MLHLIVLVRRALRRLLHGNGASTAPLERAAPPSRYLHLHIGEEYVRLQDPTVTFCGTHPQRNALGREQRYAKVTAEQNGVRYVLWLSEAEYAFAAQGQVTVSNGDSYTVVHHADGTRVVHHGVIAWILPPGAEPRHPDEVLVTVASTSPERFHARVFERRVAV